MVGWPSWVTKCCVNSSRDDTESATRHFDLLAPNERATRANSEHVISCTIRAKYHVFACTSTWECSGCHDDVLLFITSVVAVIPTFGLAVFGQFCACLRTTEGTVAHNEVVVRSFFSPCPGTKRVFLVRWCDGISAHFAVPSARPQDPTFSLATECTQCSSANYAGTRRWVLYLGARLLWSKQQAAQGNHKSTTTTVCADNNSLSSMIHSHLVRSKSTEVGELQEGELNPKRDTSERHEPGAGGMNI